MTKDPSTLGRLEARKEKTSSPSSECRREREKVLSASRGEEMYTLGKLRHQIKSISSSSEFRQDQDLLAVERAQARKRKGPQCIQGGGDVHPGQVDSPDKVLLAVERVQAR